LSWLCAYSPFPAAAEIGIAQHVSRIKRINGSINRWNSFAICYFLLTITLPQGLRDVARSHQKIVYTAMFSCAHEALRRLAKDKRFAGSTRIGYLAVLVSITPSPSSYSRRFFSTSCLKDLWR
jgi:hypothetical protein